MECARLNRNLLINLTFFFCEDDEKGRFRRKEFRIARKKKTIKLW